MGYIDETTEEGRTVERLIRFMKSVENPSWMIELVENMNNKVNMYENLEKQGKLLKLPCAVGDTVYTLNPLSDGKIVIGELKADAFFCALSTLEGRFGETIFLTLEEARAALTKITN